MSTAHENVRHGLLVGALGGPADLNAVDWHVRQHNPSASPFEVQSETLEAIRSLVSDGLFRLGGMVGQHEHAPDRFIPLGPSARAFDPQISHVYVKHYGDPERWMYSVWLQLTDTGETARTVNRSDRHRRLQTTKMMGTAFAMEPPIVTQIFASQ